VQLLLNNKADVNAQGGRFSNALQGAAYGGHQAIVQLLLYYRADLESNETINWQTPLSLAAEIGLEAFVKLLLDEGADLESKGKVNG
jgi:ankyrin repeat protein